MLIYLHSGDRNLNNDSSPQAQHAQSMKLIWRPLDLILVLLLLVSMAFTVLRGLVRTKAKKSWEMRLQWQPVFDLFDSVLSWISSWFQPIAFHICLIKYCPVHLVQAALDSPLDACSIYVQHYEPYLKDPVGFPRVMVTAAFLSSSPIVSARSILLLLADPSSNNQPTAGTQRAASLTPLLYSLSVQLIEKPFFITAAMSRGSDPPFVSPSVRYQTTMWAEVIWSPSFSCYWPDMAAYSSPWLFILGACLARLAQRTQSLSIGYPKTLLGPQSGRICESLIRQANRMVRTW